MRIKSSVLLGLILVICAISGFSLLKRLTQEVDEWRPSNLYSSTNVSRRSTFSVVSSAPASYSEAVASVSSGSGSMFRHRGASLYAPASGFAYSQSPMAGTASYSQSPIAYSQRLHTTSSAEFRSFGGGGNAGAVSMSGGSVKSSSSSVTSSSLSVSMPSTSMYAYNTNRNGSSASDMVASMSGDIALASSQAYAGIGNTTGPRGMNGRKNVPGIGGGWTGWLGNGDYWGEGYEDWAGGSNQVTWERLRALYVAATGDTDFSNEEEWEAFLAWFNSKQSDDTFGWYWVPISDAILFVLLLCLVYVVVVYRRNKMAKNVKAEK